MAIRSKPAPVPRHDHQVPEAHLRPLLDRIDIHIEVPRVEYEKLSDRRTNEPSAAIQAASKPRGKYNVSDFHISL